MHPIYLPFTEDQLKCHFAKVIKNGVPADTADSHVEYYRKSISKYEIYLAKNPRQKGKPIIEVKGPCQIEKDEKFWTASCLMTVFYSENSVEQFIELFQSAYGPKPPINIDSWEECFKGELSLFFESKLPSPDPYKQWLRKNLTNQQLIPYVLNSDDGKKNLEGPTNVDAILINIKNGFAVIIEAKVLSDISYQITYDVMRNQIARNIDVMLEKNPDLCSPLNKRDPERTLFLLVTPRIFLKAPPSRLYAYKLNEYKTNVSSIETDLPHRAYDDWESVSKRLGWLTWEHFKEVNNNCCRWL